MRRSCTAVAVLLLAGTVGCTDPSERTVGFRDEKITAAVEASLRTNVPGSIQVSTRDRVVTLDGIVPDAAARERAADLAGRADGVSRVQNNLRASVAADAPLDKPVNLPPAPELK